MHMWNMEEVFKEPGAEDVDRVLEDPSCTITPMWWKAHFYQRLSGQRCADMGSRP
jgi:hypothetical protein